MRSAYTDARAIRRKIDDSLRNIDLSLFLRFIWDIDKTQSLRRKDASGTARFPAEAITVDASSPFFAHKWRLETLVNRALLKCPDASLLHTISMPREVKYRDFAHIYNMLNSLEGAEYQEIAYHSNVFDEVHRLTQRQFEWQRGFSSLSQMYRYAYIFDGPLCRDHIKRTHGYTFSELVLFCLCIRTLAGGNPAVERFVNLQEVFLSIDSKRALFKRLSTRSDKAELVISADQRTITYSKSMIKIRPLVSTRDLNLLYTPLPELVMARATVNSFYDFHGIDSGARNEIGDRFENYARRFLEITLVKCIITPSFKYKIRNNTVASPDIFLYYNDQLPDVIFECKSSRMSFDAKFSLDPLKDDPYGYNQIAKGVFQIWRYVSQRRLQKLKAPRSPVGSVGIVLTLDSWLTMSPRRAEIISMARRFARTHNEIDRRDDIPIIFCTIEDLESVLRDATEDSFLKTLVAAAFDRRFDGWLLPSIHDRLFENMPVSRPYPFEAEVGKVLPWRETMEQIAIFEDRLK